MAKVSELLNSTELVANWMLYSKDNSNTLSLITIDKKKLIACWLGEYLQNYINTFVFIVPTEQPEIGKFLLNKAIKHFSEQNKPVDYLQVIGMSSESEQYQKLNMKPYETIYRMELSK